MRPRTTTERGYGWAHQQQRARLLRRHRDGDPCWWCGLPMYRDKTMNWDGEALAADHLNAGGARRHERAERLLNGSCNKARGDGSRDDERPAVTGRHPSEPPPEPERSHFDFSSLDFS